MHSGEVGHTDRGVARGAGGRGFCLGAAVERGIGQGGRREADATSLEHLGQMRTWLP